MSEQLKGTGKERNDLARETEKERNNLAREVEHWKKAYENSERKGGNLAAEGAEASRALKTAEARIVGLMNNERQYDSRLDGLAKENEDAKRIAWVADNAAKEAGSRAEEMRREVEKLMQKNDTLNRMVDGLEDDFKERTSRVGVSSTGSPSLLRYDVNPVF